MSAAPASSRYSAVAILLHWAIAAAIVLNAAIGWTMKGSFGAFQLHKSIGLTVLLLSVARLGWRLMNPPPPLPAAMPAWEKAIAQTTHWAFYALMLAIPLAGWVFVSTQWNDGRPLIVQTVYFGLFPVPNLFGLDVAPETARASISDASALAHKLLVWSMLALLALHAAAALKHHFADRDDVLTRMVPGLAKSAAQPRRRAALAIGFAAIAVALVWAIAARVTMPTAAPVAPAAQSAIVVEEEPAAAASSPVVADAAPAAAEAKQAPPQPPPQPPPLWAIDMEASAINFTASLTGAPARGRFARWSGEIRADPADFSTAQARFVVETGSASIGVPELQQSLVAAEGFDPGNHPQATFVLSRFARSGDGYTAQGALTVKGRTARVAIPVTLTIEGGRARASARFTLQRDVFDLGMESDPAFEFIGRDVTVDVTIAAAR
ncbi:MAG: cytochrome b/b6 domain-containing protein [Hydrogenophilaceae bacterium]|jgi:cytochrome b561|nr:cytochrome b/b6 domain-containing protein [Hydrogenophilaceae bacterium]